MAKKTTVEASDEQEVSETQVAVEETKPKKVKKTEWTVYKNGYPVRTYSVEAHGDNAEELANEFCAHSGDEVK